MSFPPPGLSRFFSRDGWRMHFVDTESMAGPNARPMVMVHGNPTWSFYWRALVGAFGSTERCVAIDHIGCGLSDKPQGYDYCFANHRDNLVALLDHLDLREITMVVHDWGGPIGLAAAIERADRIRNLVILNTGCFPPPFIPWRIRACRIPGLGTLMVQGFNLFARAATTMATSRRGGLPPDVAGPLLAPYDSWHNRIAIKRFVDDIPGSPQHRTWSQLARLEENLVLLADKPAVLIWGMRDWCFRPSCLQRMQRGLPQARTVELNSAGHYVMEDAPEAVVSAVSRLLEGQRIAGVAS